MTLSSWRSSFKPRLTLAAAADLLGIQGTNPARTYQRYETGENAVDIVFAVEIVRRTCGAVSLDDIAGTRAAWLQKKAGSARSSTDSVPPKCLFLADPSPATSRGYSR